MLDLDAAHALVDLEFVDRARHARSLEGKATVLDLFCIASDGTQVNIEVQVRDERNMVRRTLFYWAQCYQDALKRGEDYSAPRRTVTINLLGYRFLPQEEFHSRYVLYNPETRHMLTDDIEVHFLEMPKVPKKMKGDLRGVRLLEKWVLLLNNKLSKEEMEALVMSEPALKEAWDAMAEFLQSARRRRAYRQREKAERDYINAMNTATARGLEKGMEEGIAKGIEKGIAQGIEKGRAEGLAEGRAEGFAKAQKKAEWERREIALRLLRQGTPVHVAAEILARPPEEIQKLADEHDLT